MSTISNQQKHELADALKSYHEDRSKEADSKGERFSQNLLADRIGISPGQVGYIFKGEFDKKNSNDNLMLTDRIWKKVERFLGLDLKVWELDNFDSCISVFSECKLNSEQRIIDGEKGMGKTFSANYFMKRYPVNTFLVTCATDQNPKQFMIELGKAINLNDRYLMGTRYDIRVRVAEHLLSLDNPLVIVDEAENAKPAVIGALKDLYDYKGLFQQVGITIMGANDFVETLQNCAKRKVKHAYPQFLSRFCAEPAYLEGYSQAVAKDICKMHGIDDSESLQYIVSTATDYRLLNDLMHRYLSDKDLFKNRNKDAA